MKKESDIAYFESQRLKAWNDYFLHLRVEDFCKNEKDWRGMYRASKLKKAAALEAQHYDGLLNMYYTNDKISEKIQAYTAIEESGRYGHPNRENWENRIFAGQVKEQSLLEGIEDRRSRFGKMLKLICFIKNKVFFL